MLSQILVELLMSVFPLQSNDPSCKTALCNYRKLCDRIVSSRLGPLETLAQIFLKKLSLEVLSCRGLGVKISQEAKSLPKRSTKGCVEISFQQQLQAMNDISVTNGDRVWTYQTCTEW